MASNPKEVVYRFWDEVFNRRSLDTLDGMLSPGYRLHDLTNRQTYEEREEMVSLLGETLDSVPGTEVTIEEQLEAEGEKVVTRFTIRAPRPRESAEQVEISGMSISRVSGGLIEESWIHWDADRAERELEPETGYATFQWRWPPWKRR